MEKLAQKLSIAIVIGAALLFGAVKVFAYSPPVITSPGIIVSAPQQVTTSAPTYQYQPIAETAPVYTNAPVIVSQNHHVVSSTETTTQKETSSTTQTNGLLQEFVRNLSNPESSSPVVENLCSNETFTSTISYTNTTSRDATNTTITINFPQEIDFVSSSLENGSYNESTRVYTAFVGPIAKNQTGVLYITATANRFVRNNETMTIQVNVTFTAANGTEETKTSYLNFTSTDCGTNLGALALASGFFPTTFVGWLILAILLCLIIYFSRQFFGSKEGHGHGHDEGGHGHPSPAVMAEDKAWATEHGA